jgi:hypothetical protein
MGSEGSELMMALLKELSALKELDNREATPGEPYEEEHRLRDQRRREIARQIKDLAEQGA